MEINVIRSEEEYDKVCKRIYHLMHSSEQDIDPHSPEGEELTLLSLLVERYEQQVELFNAPDPVEAIRFRMEQMNLKQKDIAPIFGGKTRVSEVLNRRRPLSIKMITLLHRYLGIPLESLISGNKDFDLVADSEKELLKSASIRAYYGSAKA